MKNKTETAVAMMVAGFNCAQSVLSVFCEDLHLDNESAMKLATGFGAGMARRQEVCGAVSGGIMAIGLEFGRGLADGKTMTENTYRRVGEFMKRFSDKHGSCLCRVLLDGCDLMTESGQKFYKENGLSEKICRPCVADAVGFLEELL